MTYADGYDIAVATTPATLVTLRGRLAFALAAKANAIMAEPVPAEGDPGYGAQMARRRYAAEVWHDPVAQLQRIIFSRGLGPDTADQQKQCKRGPARCRHCGGGRCGLSTVGELWQASAKLK